MHQEIAFKLSKPTFLQQALSNTGAGCQRGARASIVGPDWTWPWVTCSADPLNSALGAATPEVPAELCCFLSLWHQDKKTAGNWQIENVNFGLMICSNRPVISKGLILPKRCSGEQGANRSCHRITTVAGEKLLHNPHRDKSQDEGGISHYCSLSKTDANKPL